jgi:hypothetical protein
VTPDLRGLVEDDDGRWIFRCRCGFTVAWLEGYWLDDCKHFHGKVEGTNRAARRGRKR